jgi:hypothetical protein
VSFLIYNAYCYNYLTIFVILLGWIDWTLASFPRETPKLKEELKMAVLDNFRGICRNKRRQRIDQRLSSWGISKKWHTWYLAVNSSKTKMRKATGQQQSSFKKKLWEEDDEGKEEEEKEEEERNSDDDFEDDPFELKKAKRAGPKKRNPKRKNPTTSSQDAKKGAKKPKGRK